MNEIITEHINRGGVDTPAIWIVQHPITPTEGDNLSEVLYLKYTIEFVCIEYDPETKIAEKLARKLAGKVALSIKKNYRRTQYDLFKDRIITNVKFNSLHPVGDINVENKRERIPVTGLILEFEFEDDWTNDC